MSIREANHRLDRILYRGKVTVALTCCVINRGQLFLSKEVFQKFERYLLEALEKHGVFAHVYLFMPDHLHLLLEGDHVESDVLAAVVLFKQKSGYWLSKSGRTDRWQKDFHDHILRSDEDVLKQVRYILENPVRAGIVDSWEEDPY